MTKRDEFYYRLNDKQRAQLTVEFASTKFVASPSPGPYAYTLRFHEAFGFPISKSLVLSPSVSDRLRRGRLILEETIETLTKGLGLTLTYQSGPYDDHEIINAKALSLAHEEGKFYDPVETADGIADINVVANGTAIEFGIPMPSVDHEVYCSNMSKLVDGKPILNRCQYWNDPEADLGDETRGHCQHQLNAIVQGQEFGPMDCHEPSHLIDPTAPVGKGLKPDTYTPANVTRVLETHLLQFGAEE